MPTLRQNTGRPWQHDLSSWRIEEYTICDEFHVDTCSLALPSSHVRELKEDVSREPTYLHSEPDRRRMEVDAKIKQVVAEMGAVREAAGKPGESRALTRLVVTRNKKINKLMRRHDQLLADLPF